MTAMKSVVIGRHTLTCNTDAYILSRRPEVAAALGIPDRQVQVVLHDLLFHMQRHRHPEEITFPVHAGDASGAKVKFRIHASPSFYTISRDDDVVRVFGKSSAGASQSASPAPAVQVSGAGVAISVAGISVDRLRAVADVLQFGTSPAEPQRHECESAAIEEAAMAKDAPADDKVVDLAERARAADKAENDEYQTFSDLFVLGPIPEKSARTPEALAKLVDDGLVEVASGFAFLTRKGIETAVRGDQPKHKMEWHSKNRTARNATSPARFVAPFLQHLEKEADGHTRRNLEAWDGFAGDLDLGVAQQHLDFWVVMSGRPTNVAFEYGRLRGIRDAMKAIGVEPKTTQPESSDGSLGGRGTLIQ